MKKINILAVLLCALWVTYNAKLTSAAQDSPAKNEPTAEVVSENTPLYEDLIRYATAWKKAILARDGQALAKMSNPYDRAQITTQMNDKSSMLYVALYGNPQNTEENNEGKTPNQKLKTAKKPKITLVALKPIRQYGVIAYYYDEADGPITLPPKDNIQDETVSDRTVACQFQWSGTTWYADFLQAYTADTED